MPQISELIELSISSIVCKCQFKLTGHENNITFPLTYLHNAKVPTGKSSPEKTHMKSSVITHFSDTNPKLFVKTTYHP